MKAVQGHPRIGLLLVLVSAGTALLIHLHPEGLRAPGWVAYTAAAAFGVAGLALLAHARGWRRAHAWLAVVLLAALLAPALWIAVANPDSGRCRLNLLGWWMDAPGAVCRTGFALGAGTGLLLLVLALRQALRMPRGKD